MAASLGSRRGLQILTWKHGAFIVIIALAVSTTAYPVTLIVLTVTCAAMALASLRLPGRHRNPMRLAARSMSGAGARVQRFPAPTFETKHGTVTSPRGHSRTLALVSRALPYRARCSHGAGAASSRSPTPPPPGSSAARYLRTVEQYCGNPP